MFNRKYLLATIMSVLLGISVLTPVAAEFKSATDTNNETEIAETEATENVTVETNERDEAAIQLALANSNIAYDEASLIAAIANALASDNADETIVVQGGVRIELSDALTINTVENAKLTFVSSDENEAVLVNANNKRHFVLSGGNAINWTFKNVVLSGDLSGGSINGGIAITNSAADNVIDGLVARDNIVTDAWAQGFVEYTGIGGDFTLRNSKFINNRINARDAVGSGIVLVRILLSNFTIENVLFDGNETLNQNGAALKIGNEEGHVVLRGLTIKNGSAKSNSAGVTYVGEYDTSLTVEDSVFENNTNSEGLAGAFNLTIRRGNSETLFKNVNFIDNYGNRGGGAMDINLAATDGSLVFDTVSFIGNKGSRVKYDSETGVQTGETSSGGALNINQGMGTMDIVIRNSKFENNEADSGGAIYLMNPRSAITNLLIDSSTFDGNTSDYMAGAIFLPNGNTSQDNSYIIKNSEIINNIVTGNDPGPGYNQGGMGGGIYMDGRYSILKLESVTFDNNASPYGILWNAESDSELAQIHASNVVDTTYSKPKTIVSEYNNAYNGDDVYVDFDAITYFYVNPAELDDLVVSNYDASEYHYYYSLLDEMNMKPIDPIAPGYRFLGWFDEDGNAWDFESTAQTEVHTRLYASWEKVTTFDVVFDLHGGTGTLDLTVTVEAGNSLTRPIDPTRDGYTFAGWYTSNPETDKNATPWDFETQRVSESMTLHAKWTRDEVDPVGPTNPVGPILPETGLEAGSYLYPLLLVAAGSILLFVAYEKKQKKSK